MRQPSKIFLYVALVTLTALVVGVLAWDVRSPFPGFWALGSFILVAFLLDQSWTRLKVEATGSTSFVIHVAAGVLFGGFWGGVVAAIPTALSQLAAGTDRLKLVFNPAQRALSVMVALLVYRLLGGGMPPAYLQMAGAVDSTALQRDIFLFFAFAGTYFIVNSVAVSGAVAISQQRSFRDVWNLNTRGVLGTISCERDCTLPGLALHPI
jgi:hypothetical protein